uniref:Uncharacterized protein n=1 Tax=Glossina palpalis gambiensis TaxID=67801 RepID=A0A1B0BQJ5_9MUSC
MDCQIAGQLVTPVHKAIMFIRIRSALSQNRVPGKRFESELEGVRVANVQNNEIGNKLRKGKKIDKLSNASKKIDVLLFERNLGRKTFADVVSVPTSDALAIIKSKCKQKSEKTKAELDKIIKICNVRRRNNGFLAIDCEAKEEHCKDKAVIEGFMPKDYGVHTSPKLHPSFKMADMSYQLTDNELIDKLRCQNPILKESVPRIVISHEVYRCRKSFQLCHFNELSFNKSKVDYFVVEYLAIEIGSIMAKIVVVRVYNRNRNNCLDEVIRMMVDFCSFYEYIIL